VNADLDRLPEMLARLGLKAMRDRLDNLLDEAGRRDLSLREALSLVCAAEVAHREERRISMGLGIAKFPFLLTHLAQPSRCAYKTRTSDTGAGDGQWLGTRFNTRRG